MAEAGVAILRPSLREFGLTPVKFKDAIIRPKP
jgi:hypothetical protein